MRILFICKYNAFRSKIAEGYFKKINRNKNIKTSGAGLIDGGFAADVQKVIAKKMGAPMKGKSRRLTIKELAKQDLVIVLANDVPPVIFNYPQGYPNAKFEYWGIKDVLNGDKKEITKVVAEIKTKVEKLVKRLEDRK